MKLVQKLALALIGGSTVLLSVNGVLRVEREVATLQADRVRDQDLVGRSLGSAFAAVWRSDGRARALAVLEESNARTNNFRVRWMSEQNDPNLRVGATELDAIEAGATITRIARDDGGEEQRFTYVPIFVDGARLGELELTESLVAEKLRTRSIVFDTLTTTTALAGLFMVLSIVLGVWLVGRPVKALSAKARRIGRGDFTTPLVLSSRDELAELANEMNLTCDRLVEANARLEKEMAARVAMIEQLRHADRLMTVGKLASGIAHELGTPLNVVSARASMIAAGDATAAEAVDYARIIGEASTRMTKIIRQLLEFARRKRAERAPADLVRLVKDTLALLRSLADKRSVSLELVAGEAEVSVDVDAGQIQQVTTNLVVNAFQSMARPGAVRVTIERTRVQPPMEHGGAEGEYVCLRVEDDGQGIRADDLPHIFEPFFTTKDVGEGTGLGLSVSYGIVQEHGGWITVESEPAKGSTFSVFLSASGDSK